MEIKVGEVNRNRLSLTIVDGKDSYSGNVHIGDIKQPLSTFCNVKEMLPLLLLFYAKTLNITTTITDVKATAEAVSIAVKAVKVEEVAVELTK